MWISKKEYEKIMDERQFFKQSAEHKEILYRDFTERFAILLNENDRLRKEIEQLKVKYVDEVLKNFELASHLSKEEKELNNEN